MKLARYTCANATPVAVAAGGNILLPDMTSNSGAFAYDGNGGIQIKRPGTYIIIADFNLVAASANGIEVTMYENGIAVPTAVAGSVPAAIGDVVNLSINGACTVIVALTGTATITFRPDIATTIENGSVLVLGV